MRAAPGLYGSAAGTRGGCRENVASAGQSGRARAVGGPTCLGRSCGLAQRVLRVRGPKFCPWVRLHTSSAHPVQRATRSREHKWEVGEA
eukprot:4075909-Prymnesium_polylepis.1